MSQSHTQLVLVRHGQSQWNLKNQFTGWYDADLTEKGYEEAQQAAQSLKKLGVTHFDHVYTSVLKRAIFTMQTILKDMDLAWLPTSKAWQLNERHYGALQGLNKEETADKYGADQVKIWRRSYATPPPPLEEQNINENEQKKYQQLGLDKLPSGESLEMTQERVLPYWTNNMAPELKKGKKLLVVAHGNSLRALVMFIEKLSSEEITQVEMATGVPVVYDLGPELEVLDKKILSH